MSTPYNEPAFPIRGAIVDHEFSGMTVRDYFAARIAEGDAATEEGWGNGASDEQISTRAKLYYRIADAMLKARQS